MKVDRPRRPLRGGPRPAFCRSTSRPARHGPQSRYEDVLRFGAGMSNAGDHPAEPEGSGGSSRALRRPSTPARGRFRGDQAAQWGGCADGSVAVDLAISPQLPRCGWARGPASAGSLLFTTPAVGESSVLGPRSRPETGSLPALTGGSTSRTLGPGGAGHGWPDEGEG